MQSRRQLRQPDFTDGPLLFRLLLALDESLDSLGLKREFKDNRSSHRHLVHRYRIPRGARGGRWTTGLGGVACRSISFGRESLSRSGSVSRSTAGCATNV